MNIASLLASGGQSLNVPLVLLLIKATTILLAALGMTVAMQRASAGARHLVWLVTLGALLLIPALTAWGPLRLEVLPAADAAATPAVLVTPAPSVKPAPEVVITNGSSSIVATGAPSAAPATSRVTSTTASASSARGGLVASISDASLWVVALTLWAVVAFAIIVSLTWSTLVVRRLVRRSEPLDDQTWLTPLYEVSDRMGLDEPPRLLMSRDAKMPFACGLTTPTIVLPAECESWSHERRLAVLLHELAHVRRRDLLGHTLGRLVCAQLRAAGMAVPVAATPTGRWWFPVTTGGTLPDPLREDAEVVLHTGGAAVLAPPSETPDGWVHWRVAPGLSGYRPSPFDPIIAAVLAAVDVHEGDRLPVAAAARM